MQVKYWLQGLGSKDPSLFFLAFECYKHYSANTLKGMSVGSLSNSSQVNDHKGITDYRFNIRPLWKRSNSQRFF